MKPLEQPYQPGEAAIRIRKARESLGISQIQLACKLGVTNSCISFVETGRNQAGPDLLRKLCEYLGLNYVQMADLTVQELSKRLRHRYGMED